MDFHSLSRKELQTLCKKNKIPANITNVAMADALTALDKVEGLDEFINAIESDSQKSPERLMPESPGIPRTACTTATRRRQTNVESQSVVSTRRTTGRSAAEEADQENKNVNQLVTPAAPASRTRRTAAAASARQKTLTREEKSVQRAPTTRQSVRLLEQSMREMSLKEKGKAEPVKFGGLEKEVEDIVKKEGDVSGSDKVSDEIVDRIASSEDFSTQNRTVDNGNADEDKLREDSKGNEYEMENCSVKLDFDGEDNLGNPSGLDAKRDVDGDNIDKLNFSQFQDRKSENSINENEADPSGGEDNETMNDAVISEITREVNSNDAPSVVEMTSDGADSAMKVKKPEIATSQDEEFANEIKDFLNMQGLVSDDSKINLIQGEQHGDLDVDSTFSIKVESDGKQLKKQENEAQELVQEQVSHPSEPVLCEKLASRDEPENLKLNQEYEEYDQVSSDPVMEWAENNEPLADLDVIKHEEVNDCSSQAESEVTQVSVNSNKAYLEETKVIENHVSETSVNVHVIPEEQMIVSSNFECPSTLNNPTSNVISKMVSSPFAADTFRGQFPRPTVSAPMKCPTKKDIAVPMASHLAGIDEENIDNSGKKLEAKKDEVNIMADEEIQYEKLSLRQLSKMVKELQISKNKEEKNANKAAKTRLPLQRLPENGMTTTESESGKEF